MKVLLLNSSPKHAVSPEERKLWQVENKKSFYISCIYFCSVALAAGTILILPLLILLVTFFRQDATIIMLPFLAL